jgi:predicted nucleic acid-binding Zn ribbon protein
MAFAPRRPDARPAGPTSIGRLMSRLMSRTGYDREQAAEGLAAAWREAAPPALQAASRPGLVRRGVLEVFVSHSALVQELGFQKREVLARLAELLPAAGITDIRCRVMADAGTA